MKNVWEEILDDIDADDRARGWRWPHDPYVHAELLDAKAQGVDVLRRVLDTKYPYLKPYKVPTGG